MNKTSTQSALLKGRLLLRAARSHRHIFINGKSAALDYSSWQLPIKH